MNAAEAYSDLKVAWHLDRIAALRETGRCVPAQIQLVISDFCNHDCSFCAYRLSGYTSNQLFAENGEHNPRRFIPHAKATEILRDAAGLGVLAVQFTGGGEPTVHPHHLEIFRDALHFGLKCSLVTNGTLLRPGWHEVLPQFEWVRVSLDAGTMETYCRVRRVTPPIWEKTLKNIGQLAKLREVGVSFVVTRENFRECAEAAIVARGLGAQSIRFAAMFSPGLLSYYDEFLDDALAHVAAACAKTRDGFVVHDMFSQRLGDLRQGRPDYKTCGYQQLNVYIGGDQNVYRCCNTAYNKLGHVGSLKEQSFAEFWRSPAAKAAYASFDARACAHCAFNGKNKILDYMVGTPTHVEFA